MKTIVTTITAALFAASVGATDIYHGLGDGNADLPPQRNDAAGFVGAQPGVGDNIDRYHGLADGNPDLFQSSGRGPVSTGNASDIDQVIYFGPDRRF